jgi:hypothetical protein
MEWINLLQNLGAFLIAVTGGGTVIYFVMKEIFKLHLAKDLERFKSLHTERMIIYKDAFQKVCELYDSMNDMVRFHGDEDGRTEREKDSYTKAQDFKRFIERNELFFDKTTYCELQSVYKNVDEKVWSEYHYSRALKGYDNTEAREALMKVWGILQKEAPEIKTCLADTFRTELGA